MHRVVQTSARSASGRTHASGTQRHPSTRRRSAAVAANQRGSDANSDAVVPSLPMYVVRLLL
jgi:hypothetical protein